MNTICPLTCFLGRLLVSVHTSDAALARAIPHCHRDHMAQVDVKSDLLLHRLQADIRVKLAEQPGDGSVPDLLIKGKEKAEQDLKELLAGFKQHAQSKIDLCQERQQHKVSLQKVLQAAEARGASKIKFATSSEQWSLEHAKHQNSSQMTACQCLVTAYAASKRAREQLQACLEEELKVLNELHDPVHLCLQQSVRILHTTADQLQGDDPQREQRYTEMLIRYVTGFFCLLWLQFMRLSHIQTSVLRVLRQ